jgi:hypothetical protein
VTEAVIGTGCCVVARSGVVNPKLLALVRAATAWLCTAALLGYGIRVRMRIPWPLRL